MRVNFEREETRGKDLSYLILRDNNHHLHILIIIYLFSVTKHINNSTTIKFVFYVREA